MKRQKWLAIATACLIATSAGAADFELLPGAVAHFGAVYNPITNTTYLAVTQLDNAYDQAWHGIEALRPNGGPVGWLATINSRQENDFLVNTYLSRGLDLWGYRMGATLAHSVEPSGVPIPDYTGPWYWNNNINEPMGYSNWGVGQPDNHLGAEFLGIFWDHGTWNDTQYGGGFDTAANIHYHLGYVVEFSGNVTSAVPETDSASLVLLGLGGLGWAVRRRNRRLGVLAA